MTVGLATEQGQPRRQPVAMERTAFYVTVLDAEDRPVGRLLTVGGQQLRGYLVARDMRQFLYAESAAPLREGADARKLMFRPREGGDHALLVAFVAPDSKPRTVSAPIVIKGALPSFLGPGVKGLSSNVKLANGRISVLHADALVNAPLTLRFKREDLRGRAAASSPDIDSVVVFDDALGSGQWLSRAAEAPTWRWVPRAAGDFLLLATLRSKEERAGARAPPRVLAFKINVTKPPEEAAP